MIELPKLTEIEFHYKPIPRKMGDCRTQAFCMLLNHYGIDIIAQEIFGIGSGLNFSIKKIMYENFELLTISGRDFNAEKRCCELLNVQCIEQVCKVEDIQSKAIYQNILPEIAAGNPVLVECDVFYMPYLESKHHNPYHLIIVIGYDLERNMLKVVDSLTGNTHKVHMDILLIAMLDKQYEENKLPVWYKFKLKNNVVSNDFLESNYIHALNQQYKKYQEKNGALSALRDFIEFLRKIEIKSKEGSKSHTNYLNFIIEMNCILVRNQDELNGTCFRSLYKEYIKELDEKFSDDSINFKNLLQVLEKSELAWKKISFETRYIKKDLEKKHEMFFEALELIYEAERQMSELMQSKERMEI